MKENSVFLNWLHKRYITDAIIAEFNLSTGIHHTIGDCLTIPVYNENGDFSFNKYRRNPTSPDKPKYVYDAGGHITLYGFHKAKNEDTILITEGEMDALVAWSHHIPAVTSTGGAQSFQKEWGALLADKEIIVCFDNDEAGARGMVKVLDIIPHASFVFLPDRPGIKDISDYVTSGGDLSELLRTKVHFSSLQDVIDNRSVRLSLWQSTFFHDIYIQNHTLPTFTRTAHKKESNDVIVRAREYPINKLLAFNSSYKCPCIWHTERTPSLHYFSKTNTVYCFGCGKFGDAIDVYRQLHSCSFKEAISKLS